MEEAALGHLFAVDVVVVVVVVVAVVIDAVVFVVVVVVVVVVALVRCLAVLILLGWTFAALRTAYPGSWENHEEQVRPFLKQKTAVTGLQ